MDTLIKQQIRGARSRAVGEHFETMIVAACRYYEDKGVSVIHKTPEPMKIIQAYDRRNGRFIACFAKKAQPDFKGIIQDGTMVLFDAKHTDADRIERKAVSDEQESCFERYMKMGAQCFVVVSIGFQDFYRIPWVIFRNMKKLFGHKYMNKSELEPYQIQYMNGILKFLDGLELSEKRREEIVDGS